MPSTPRPVKSRRINVISPRSLELPPALSLECLYAVNLDPELPSHNGLTHIVPEAGTISTLLALADETGIPAKTFWTMFRRCIGCSRIMTGDVFEDHICDLTS